VAGGFSFSTGGRPGSTDRDLGPRRARATQRGSFTNAGRLDRRAQPAARPRQLRALDRRLRPARCVTPQRVPPPASTDDKPRAFAHFGRTGLPRPVVGHRQAAFYAPSRPGHAVCVLTVVRPARSIGPVRLRPNTAQCHGGGGNLCSVRRSATGDRASRGVGACARRGPDSGAAGRHVRIARGRQPVCTHPPANHARHHGLELRPAGRDRAWRLSAARDVCRRLESRSGGERLLESNRRAARSACPPDPTGGRVAGPGGETRGADSVRAAGACPPVRTHVPERVGRIGRGSRSTRRFLPVVRRGLGDGFKFRRSRPPGSSLGAGL
jgi:hypothetical protein